MKPRMSAIALVVPALLIVAFGGGAGGMGMTQNVIQSSGQLPAELEGALAPGGISVTAKVTVSFEME